MRPAITFLNIQLSNSREQPDRGAFVLGVLVIAALTVISGRIYAKRDLAS